MKKTYGYFAAAPAADCAQDLLSRSRTFYKTIYSNRYIEKLNKIWRFYHGNFNQADEHAITFTGEQGELVNLPVNHFRNFGEHIINMITSNRLVLDSRAINSDYKSLSQTYLSNGILDYYMREKGLENCLTNAAKMGVIQAAGFIKLSWNATAGEVTDYFEDTGEFNYQGDVEFTVLGPLDVIVDGTKESYDNDWVVTRTWKNKYDMMAKFPELAEEFESVPSKSDNDVYKMSYWSNDKTDDIAVYEFFHKKTESMPEGRYMQFFDNGLVALDTKLPYRRIPVFRMAPSTITGTPYGYTPLFDLYPLQEAMNSVMSSMMTNQEAFGVQSLFVHNDANIAVEDLGEGMRIIKGDMKPEPINFEATAKTTFDYYNLLVQTAETISGVNSVTRGNPEASLRSGSALALVQSMSLQYMSELQRSYVKMAEDVGTALIEILKDFASTPRIAAIVGRNNRTTLKEFTGESLSAINRVVVDIGNPLSRTLSGRTEMATNLLQQGMLKSPEQYFQVLNTGRLDMVFEGEMQETLLIKNENERLMDGDAPIVSPLDQHSLHIREHKSVLADPELRKDANLVKNTLDHIQQHLEALRNTDPALLQLVGEQAIPPLEQTLQPPMGQGQSQGSNAQVTQPPSQDATQIQGGSLQSSQNLPSPSKVDPNLLPNPSLQEQSMGNLK